MSQIKITLEINSIAELDGLEAALDLYAASEGERIKDEIKSNPKGRALMDLERDRARQQGAARLLKSIRGER